MQPVNGFNPLRWKCEKDGCFNQKRRPKIEVFADCFPGRINFGDVDGLVEVRGKFCLLEWKGDGGSVNTGQHISFGRFTATKGNAVFVVHGEAESMQVLSHFVYWLGKRGVSHIGGLDLVKARIAKWAEWARKMRF